MNGNAVATLQHVPLFHNMPSQFLRHLAQVAICRRFRAGDVLCCKGEMGSTLFILLKGQVMVVGVDDGGREVLLNLLKPGDFFGELSLIDGRPRSADVVALTDGEALLVRRSDFMALAERMPSLIWQLMEALAKRVREADELVMRMAWLNAPERVAWALLEFANQQGQLPQWVNINILAKRCGLARETANRIVSQWQKEGILLRTKEGFVITKPSKLQEMLRTKTAITGECNGRDK
ncbi:MAG: Crp/Fnr family transcriptional regulator [Armatimonadetes bacterium]|nr:Crp/Fnr family transcriptional regulator [Armatimonadota bacterium]